MTQNTDTNHDIDRHIGQRIRVGRLAKPMTQRELGAALGLTSQQVHKYEMGENHISAARLYQIATALGMAPGDFYPRGDRPLASVNGMSFDELAGLIERPDILTVLFALKTAKGKRRAWLIEMIARSADAPPVQTAPRTRRGGSGRTHDGS